MYTELNNRKVEPIKDNRIHRYFRTHLLKDNVTWWKPFRYGKNFYIMTFQNNLYKVISQS